MPVISVNCGNTKRFVSSEQALKEIISNKLNQEITRMNIRPLHDRVVVRRMEDERTTAGGIVIPDSAAEKPMRGEIIAIGAGKVLDNGDLRALAVKVGEVVLFGKYSGTEFKINGQELVVMREDDIMGVVEK
jgi:chaperonin GroES